MNENEILKTMRAFASESGLDSQIDLRALQAVGIAKGDSRILRVWFNDGRIRDWDCGEMIASGKGRIAELVNADFFATAATVWDGAPGFDFSGCHNESGCLDFDPYDVWVGSKDVTRQVLSDEQSCGRSDMMAGESEYRSVAENEKDYGRTK